MDMHNTRLGSLSVVIPIYNERGNLKPILEEWAKTPFEIIVVDDGSTDNPEQILKDFPNIKVLKNERNRGYGWSLKRGIKESKGKWIVIQDGDGSYTTHDTWRLINFMDDHFRNDVPDMAICDRRLKGEEPHRIIGRKILNFLASCFCRRWLPDLNSGCRIFRRDLAISYMPIICDTFSFTTTTTMMFLIDGYKVEFFPSKILPRKYGKSKVNVIKDGFITLKLIFYIGLALRSRRIREKYRRLKQWLKRR